MSSKRPRGDETWREALQVHREDPFAHGAMLAQRAQQYITLQENYENRLRNVEKAQEAFGRFKAQATLLGGLGLTLLGALSFAVFGHFIR